MISIIVCSIKPVLLKEFKANVETTIGVDYELIIIDNKVEQLSICEAYNKGASQAQFENLAFCHEDILFHTQNWGEELIKLLIHQQIGLVGIAGATFKSKYPLSWVAVNSNYYRSNATFEKPATHNKEQKSNLFDEVAVLDGMFLCTTKSIWKKNKFNEVELKGFHLYDMDYSYQLFENYKIVVCNTIKIEHRSRGSLDLNWFKQSIKWHKGKLLPIYTDSITTKEVINLERRSHELYLSNLISFGWNMQSWLNEYFKLCINNRKLYLGLFFRILNKIIDSFLFKIKRFTAPFRKKVWQTIYRLRLKNKDFCIVSNNCWGGDLYEALDVKYNTPFVGLFLNAPCYLKLLNNFEYYMSCDLKFVENSKYNIQNISCPVGLLDDVEVHFLHYKSESEAREKWNRRKARMPQSIDSYLFKIDDRDFATSGLINEFHKLSYKNKVSFTKEKYPFSNNLKLNKAADLILLHTTYNLLDIPRLINEGETKNTLLNKLLSILVPYPSKWL